MISLSFFNLSPRPDKDDAYLEAKASSIVTRLKMENLAVARFLQCEVQLKLHSIPENKSSAWDASTPPYEVVLDSNSDKYFEFKYPNSGNPKIIKPTDALLPGYVVNSNDKIYHFVYCLDKPIEESGANIQTPCIYGSTKKPAYVVSFAPIPSRWVSKIDHSPLPTFLGYLSEEDKFGGAAGYTKCSSQNNCQLLGMASHSAKVEKIKVDGSETIKKSYIKIAADSPIWSNNTFMGEELNCTANNNPCMLIYRPLRETGGKNYCRELIKQAE